MVPVAKTPRFTSQVDALRSKYNRIDDAMDGAVWAVSRNPEGFDLLFPSFGGRGFKFDSWPGVPAAIVYYTFDDEKVTFYAIYETTGPSGPVM